MLVEGALLPHVHPDYELMKAGAGRTMNESKAADYA